MRMLKGPLRSMIFKQGNIHKKVVEWRHKLNEIQRKIDAEPWVTELREAESMCMREFHEASLDEERFLKQKFKVDWLAAGDGNTSFFHNSLKCRTHRGRIDVIMDPNGQVVEGSNVLGTVGEVSMPVSPDLFSQKLDHAMALSMVQQQVDKIKENMREEMQQKMRDEIRQELREEMRQEMASMLKQLGISHGNHRP
ncbi:hypothetical protein QVD17_30809 [Tagetes erecta]|uniref:Uncharacterized protein n=1 Tax=Tagetes erecta TaxID=13708 RepID=A0AAD8K270_TARER|nr:hypothetical protein QVD17_30809 [Tagetes erecta]